jgi:hypothetical protein
MVRLFAFLAALVITLTGAWLAARGADGLLLFLQVHPLPKWFGRSFGVYICIFAGFFPIMIVAMESRGRRLSQDEDASLTPKVRRLASGLREL